MTSKKGGGRESGNVTADGSTGSERRVPAEPAANPAAHVHRIMNYEEPPYPEDCLPCAEREERIRALEASVKELDAMLYEMRSQRDYAIAVQEDRER